ncbi:MAG: hypothetical protein GXP62_20790 [Oligoflexia bacterium]|nr:hypothetical protein [Oligoflexia bacterium]
MNRAAALGMIGCIWLLLAGCTTETTPMPTVAEVAAAADDDTRPPLYQLLYDAPLLPRSRPEQQRVRILIWLRHMDFGDAQLQQLDALRVQVAERTQQLADAERKIEQGYQTQADDIYQGLWDRLSTGAPGDTPEVVDLTERLADLQKGSERERALLTARITGIRSALDAETPFLKTLSPRQEALLADALFFLRNHLDPVGNPGDFRVLVGSTYAPGQYAVLTRGTSRWAREPLNIGGLWSDEPPLAGGSLHEARREVLLYLALLEPGLDEAIQAARTILAQELDLGLGDVPDAAGDTGRTDAVTPAATTPSDAEPEAKPNAEPNAKPKTKPPEEWP